MLRGNLLAARQHALTIEQLAVCAPPVCAPYLQAAYDRMKLPISVVWDENGGYPTFWLVDDHDPDDPMGPNIWGARTPAEATTGYLSICARLTESAQTPPGADIAAPVGSSPGPMGAAVSSSEAP